MHTISSLRKTLGLATTNQVRNRIDSIRDVLAPHLRRGPNNQLLVADEGVALLRQLQEAIELREDLALAAFAASTAVIATTKDRTPATPPPYLER